MKWQRHIARLLCSAGLTLSGFAIGPSAQAKDLVALVDLLTPAYTAMSLANLCAMDADWTIVQPRGWRGAAINYAEHVKDEVIVGLEREEARVVLRSAADSARSHARAQLRENVVVPDKDAEVARFREWCESYVAAFIRELIRRHDGEHLAFLERIDRATSGRKPPGEMP
jgi:hypothetical protein